MKRIAVSQADLNNAFDFSKDIGDKLVLCFNNVVDINGVYYCPINDIVVHLYSIEGSRIVDHILKITSDAIRGFLTPEMIVSDGDVVNVTLMLAQNRFTFLNTVQGYVYRAGGVIKSTGISRRENILECVVPPNICSGSTAKDLETTMIIVRQQGVYGFKSLKDVYARRGTSWGGNFLFNGNEKWVALYGNDPLRIYDKSGR